MIFILTYKHSFGLNNQFFFRHENQCTYDPLSRQLKGLVEKAYIA
jgi:hypothetical protein